MRELLRLLSAREERAFVQKFLLKSSGIAFAVQISLNIPGLPKRIPGDFEAVSRVSGFFLKELDAAPSAIIEVVNFGGVVRLMPFRGGTAREKNVKEIAVRVEEEREWGRVCDIDVITSSGPLSRISMGFKERKCLLCGLDAKVCARMGTHGIDEIRAEALRLFGLLHG